MPSTRKSSSLTNTTLSGDENGENDKIVKKSKFENSWMFLSKDKIFKSNSSTSIITLVHPGYQEPMKVLLDSSEKKIYELRIYNEPNRSWLIGETVSSEGNIYMTTPLDPIFIILPYLRSQCMSRAIPLEQLLISDKIEDLKCLNDLIDDLSSVADLKGPAELCAYKYNEEKTLDWLEAKVRRLVAVLRKENIHVKSGAVSATFISSSLKEDEEDDESYLKYAHGIVSEYLEDDLSQLLFEKFKFKQETIDKIGNKRKSQQEAKDGEQNKKVKRESVGGNSDVEIKSEFFTSPKTSEVTKAVVLTTKEKQLKKAATGSKNIMSFFGKKT